jgi:hypothetical protein
MRLRKQIWESAGFLRNANSILLIDENKTVFYAMQTDFWADERALRANMVTFAMRINFREQLF